jgi:glyoxylase I family protein
VHPFLEVFMTQSKASVSSSGRAGEKGAHPRDGMAVVRYQVADLQRAIEFYVERLGFQLEHRAGAAFGEVSRGALRLLLSGPGSSGSRPMPDGRRQEPGGWNRIVLFVERLAPQIEALRAAGVCFRNSIESGPGGQQIQIEDADGNPIELHEPASV